MALPDSDQDQNRSVGNSVAALICDKTGEVDSLISAANTLQPGFIAPSFAPPYNPPPPKKLTRKELYARKREIAIQLNRHGNTWPEILKNTAHLRKKKPKCKLPRSQEKWSRSAPLTLPPKPRSSATPVATRRTKAAKPKARASRKSSKSARPKGRSPSRRASTKPKATRTRRSKCRRTSKR